MMGTNYYATKAGQPCPTCGHDPEAVRLHIGKSSAGWVFALHVEPDDEDHPHSWEEWCAFLTEDGVTITDEYGDRVTFERLRSVVEERAWLRDWGETPYGYSSWAEFHERNHSEQGPNGLVRAKVGQYCIGHGEGTWDLHVGRFS